MQINNQNNFTRLCVKKKIQWFPGGDVKTQYPIFIMQGLGMFFFFLTPEYFEMSVGNLQRLILLSYLKFLQMYNLSLGCKR